MLVDQDEYKSEPDTVLFENRSNITFEEADVLKFQIKLFIRFIMLYLVFFLIFLYVSQDCKKV